MNVAPYRRNVSLPSEVNGRERKLRTIMEFLHGNYVRIKRVVMLDNITAEARRRLLELRVPRSTQNQ